MPTAGQTDPGSTTMHATLSRRTARVSDAPLAATAAQVTDTSSVFSRCAAAVRGLLPHKAAEPLDGASRISRFDAFEQPAAWNRCREAGWYHLSRARRAIDRGDWDAAEGQAREALSWDDTRAAHFVALGEALMRRPRANQLQAREALESAFALEPSNSYLIERLRQVYLRLGDTTAEMAMLRRALAAGAPRQTWEPELARLESHLEIPLAS